MKSKSVLKPYCRSEKFPENILCECMVLIKMQAAKACPQFAKTKLSWMLS